MANISNLRQNGIVLAGFVAFIAILAALMYIPARAARADTQTWNRAQEASGAINNYMADKSALPENLAAAGFKKQKQSGITYHKDSESAYTFCVTYKHAGSVNPDQVAGPVDAVIMSIGSSFNDSLPSDKQEKLSPEYLTLPQLHKAGKQCQTIKPPVEILRAKTMPLTQAANGHTLVCNVEVNRYAANGPILKFTNINVGLNNSPTLIPVTMVQVNASQIPGDAGGMEFMYRPGSKIFNQQCKELNLSDLKVGDTVGAYSVYTDVDSTTVFLKQ